MDRPNRLESQSADGVQLNLDALYQIAPSCFTEALDAKTGEVKRKVDFNTLRQLLGDNAVEDAPEAYMFNWVGKQAARAEVLRPTKKTLRPVKEDSVDWDNTQNLYIEGDNLEVLKLLQKSYLGKVKMIYIDPPYNTGNDFIYHDNFAISQEEYDETSGAVDELGNRYVRNTDSNGRYHSDWCSMIYSRLLIARSLLKEDGSIFVTVDDHEIGSTRKIMDEIFGEKAFISTIIWENFYGRSNAAAISPAHNYILVYSKLGDEWKNIRNLLPRDEASSSKYKNPDNDPRGPWRLGPIFASGERHEGLMYSIRTPSGKIVSPPSGSHWRMLEKDFWDMYNDGRIMFGMNGTGSPAIKLFLRDVQDGMVPRSIWTYSEVGHTQDAKRELQNLFPNEMPFDTPKPTKLIKQISIISCKKDDLVLDFFSGSATTADAIMQLNAEDGGNRKFIMVQLPEETPEDSDARKKGYMNICQVGKERIRRAGKKIKEDSPLTTQDLDTGFRVFRLDEGNFESVEFSPNKLQQEELELFLNNIKSDRNDLDLLFGCMLDWGVQLSLPMTSEVVDGKTIYTVNDGDLVACFAENVTDDVVRAMANKMPLRVIFRDSCFAQDADKINIYETFKQLLDWSDQEVIKNIRVI